MIAILCPTVGRPHKCKAMIDSVRETVCSPVNIQLAIDQDEKEKYEAVLGLKEKPNHICYRKGMPTVYKWNMLASVAFKNPEIKLFMLGADDMAFRTSGWDIALIEHYESLTNKIHVYALQDSRDVTGTPHPIVTREYIEAMGYFLPPIFLHWCVDVWTREIAQDNNCFTHLTDFVLLHDKDSDDDNPDETHLNIRRMGWHKRDISVRESCKHFLEFEKARLAKAIVK